MPMHVAMLRGVNVGARNRVKMTDLVKLFEELGHTNLATYIQSGNVVFSGRSKDTAVLSRAIEQRLSRDLGLDVAVLIRTHDELAAVERDNPFVRAGSDLTKLHVTFLADEPDAELVRALDDFDAGNDRIEVRGREAYLFCPDGYGTTKLNPAFIERRLKTVSTTRNWKTVTTLLDLASVS